MPNRILKESICVSESVDKLSWFEEVLFYRLIVNCDDFGRFDARPAVVKSRLFPLKERLTTKDVSVALQHLADAGIVIMYICDNKPYLYLPSWEAHQAIRAKKSRFPSPDGNVVDCKHLQANDFKCMQMHANVSENPNPNKNPNTNPNTNTNASAQHVLASDRKNDFDAFWDAYPKKVGKKDAEKAWSKVAAPIGDILSAIDNHKASQQWSDPKYIPNPATWLNGQRWNDVLPAAAPDRKHPPTGATGLSNAELEAIQKTLSMDWGGGIDDIV